jgi:hypothetical protein
MSCLTYPLKMHGMRERVEAVQSEGAKRSRAQPDPKGSAITNASETSSEQALVDETGERIDAVQKYLYALTTQTAE